MVPNHHLARAHKVYGKSNQIPWFQSPIVTTNQACYSNMLHPSSILQPFFLKPKPVHLSAEVVGLFHLELKGVGEINLTQKMSQNFTRTLVFSIFEVRLVKGGGD